MTMDKSQSRLGLIALARTMRNVALLQCFIPCKALELISEIHYLTVRSSVHQGIAAHLGMLNLLFS
ncbi:MAG: hypothetical protein AAB680_06030 [Pseudomonadota bacterium]